MHADYHAIVTRKIQTKNRQLGRNTMIRWENDQPSLARKVCSLSFVARFITRKIYPRIQISPVDSFTDLCAGLSLGSLGSPDTQSCMSTAAYKKWFAADKKILWTKKNTRKQALVYYEYNARSHTPTTICEIERTKGGRPAGTTNKKKWLYEKASIASKNEVTTKFMEEAKNTKNGKRMKKGVLQSIIEDVHTKRNLLPEFSVSLETIRQRVSRNSYYLMHRGHP